jgi:hypothetical protein
MKIQIGFTKTFREGWKGSTIDYVPSMDGYHDGAEQDVLTFEIDVETRYPEADWKSVEVGEAFFTATNAPEEVVARFPLAQAIVDVVKPMAERGEIQHRLSLSVGDTIQVNDGPLFVVAPFGFEQHKPGQVTCGRGGPYVGTGTA